MSKLRISNSTFDIPTETTSNKHYDSDEIPELSPHHSGVYDEDQLGKNELKNNSMIELELARLRITQLKKEIELEKLRCQRCEGSGQSVSNSENAILRNLYLPKREVVRFDGTPTNYWNFIRNFEECIGSENIGFRAKLNYLVQYCDGEAKGAILHCTILEPEIGYHQALKLLEEMFGQKHVVARTFIDNSLNFPNIRRNQPDGLRRLSREMQACSLTLEQMNYVSDLNSSRVFESMVLKLPTHIQQEWLKVAYKIIRGGREPLFTDIVEFVKEQVDIANTRYGLLVNRGKDKFKQLYSTESKDLLSRTLSMSVEDRTALSESTYGVAEYTCSENVSRQVHCSFLLTEYDVVKPKTEAPSANKSKSTLRKLKEKKDIKLKVKTTKKPKQVAHIRRGIEDSVEKSALIRVVNKSKGASGSSIGANAILRQIMCIWNQNKTVNALLERGCEWRFKLPRARYNKGNAHHHINSF
ncbi:unnamed protein product [Schistosoma margrebowiei]|uniref:Uncharacterized protein n=1 Tax=Schistosoma margrebowiei TaxID=48269 RepID=A0A183MHX2_9TREM|nr:unnamed protein product [Schistosoma margrebowiei]